MNGRTAVFILRIVLGLVVSGYSAALALAQFQGRTHWVLLALGLAELAGAILFLIPASVRLGGIALIIVFGLGAAVHVLHGERNVGYLAIYAAAACAVISNRERA